MRHRVPLAALLFAAALFAAPSDPPVLTLPGASPKPITTESLLGAGRAEVRVEDEKGNATTYRGLPLLSVLESAGLDVTTMPSQRQLAPAVVVAEGRDGYTVAFSIGELLMQRGDPRAYLVAETTAGPLPPDQGPVRLIVVGQRARSAFALAKVEVRLLAKNPPKKAPPS